MAKRGKQKQKGKPQAAAAVEAVSAAPDQVVVAEPVEASAPEPEEALQADVQLEPADALEVAEAAEAAAPDVVEPPVQEAPRPARAKPSRRVSSRPRDKRSPFLVLADYEQRSLAHVAGLPEQLDAPGLWRGVAYRVGSHRLASGFDEVVEIMPLPLVSHVPGSLPWMLGVANVRGTLLPGVDLRVQLCGPAVARIRAIGRRLAPRHAGLLVNAAEGTVLDYSAHGRVRVQLVPVADYSAWAAGQEAGGCGLAVALDEQ